MRRPNSVRRLVSPLAIYLLLAAALALLVTSTLLGPPSRPKEASAQVETPTATATTTPSATPTANPRCDLTVTTSGSPDPVAEGGQITYIITLANAGSGAGGCSDLTVDDVVPDNTDCTDATVDSSSDIAESHFDINGCDTSGTVEWTTDSNLDTGDQVVLTMVVDLTAGATEGDRITNEACATSTDDADGDCDSASTTVGPSGSISGTVRDSASNPIAYPYACAWSNAWYCGNSNSDGTYIISGLAPGSYIVWATAGGYAAEFYDGRPGWDGAASVTVTDGQTTSGINFALDLAASISGTVKDAGGNPLADAYVEACPIISGGYCESSGTDAFGIYSIGTLNPAVAYSVQASASGYVSEYWDGVTDQSHATPISLVAGQETAGIDFTLDLGGTISGKVTNADSNPIQNCSVCAESWDGNGSGDCGFTDGDGNYSLAGLATDWYRVNADCVGYVSEYYEDSPGYSSAAAVHVVAGQDTPGIDFALDLAASISGTVKDAGGNSLANANVQACPTGSGGSCGYASTDGSGHYTIGTLDSKAEYWVQASASGYVSEYWDGVRDESQATLLSLVAGQETAGIDFSLDLGATVSGTVTDTDGHPIAECSVEAFSLGNGPWRSGNSDGNGAYTISGLSTGDYQIGASCAGYVYEWYDNVRDSADITPVHVVEGQNTPNIDFTLDLGGTISGKVTNAQGKPIQGVTVWALLKSDSSVEESSQTDPGGYYEISGLKGQYVVWTDSTQNADEYYNNKMSESQADVVNVVGGQVTSGIDFTLGPAGSISGEILTAGGQPISGADVMACPQDGVGDGGCTSTTSAVDGTYTITGLDYVSYVVYASASGYALQYYQDVTLQGDATPVVISQAHLIQTGINIHLIVGGSISGIVTDGQGNPLGGILVSANPPGNSSEIWQLGTTQADGSYVIANLPPGSYAVWTTPGQYAPEYYDGVRWPDVATSVSVVGSADTPNIDFVLVRGGSMSGVVTDSGGHPVAGARVFASPVNRTVPWWWSIVEEFLGWSSATTAADGSYTIAALPGASYQVWMQDPDDLTKYYDGTFLPADATPVLVTEGANTPNINFGATARVLGDAGGDGALSMVDAMFTAQCVVGLRDCGSINSEMGDVNYCKPGGEGVTMVDAMLVAQKVVGLISQFPCPSPPPSP